MVLTSDSNKQPSQHIELVDSDTKRVETVTTSEEDQHVESGNLVEDGSMTKTKWLACIALCLSYTTAYQQNACTAAIVNHIKIGECRRPLSF